MSNNISILQIPNLWCYRCQRIQGGNADNCRGCRPNVLGGDKPPTKFKFIEKNKEEKNMIVTIIGSLTKKKEMDEIKAFWESKGAIVNSPIDPVIQKEPLLNIQQTWIKKIEEADLIIAIPKQIAMTANGDNKYILEFGESTSYEMATAYRLNKKVLFG